MSQAPGRIAIVVLGEIARSPRMENHARCLLARGYDVCLLGYSRRQTNLPAKIRICPLRAPARARPDSSRSTFVLRSALRMTWLGWQLLSSLIREKPQCILVQNPPSFPTLIVSWLAARILKARLIVDWHNYGYSMLALRLTAGHPLVRLARRYEFRAARLAAAHLCVSSAMRDDLRRAAIHARVLYDRPVEFTASRIARDGSFVVVCPSGWTADERMDLVLDALRLIPARHRSPRFEIHLTGDGPLREACHAEIESLRQDGLNILTGFHSQEDYRELLQRAHLGLSAHCSSSGLDLAMKVVDLFGARVPVCAWNYGGSLPEQIDDGVTGFLFHSAEELSAILQRLLDDPAPLSAMRTQIEQRWQETWQQAWDNAAADLFAAHDTPLGRSAPERP